MAIVHFINSKSKQTVKGMAYVLRYTTQDSKTRTDDSEKLVTGVNCNADSAYTEFCNTKKLFGKQDGRQYYHFVQSFDVDENISPQLAHEIALRFASETEKFNGFEIVVSTHCDRDHIHSHFVMNSVNAENGKKFHINESEVEELMTQSDKLCLEYGLSVVEKSNAKPKAKNMSDREYRSAVKRESWKIRLEAVISNAMTIAKSKEHFIMLVEFEGYKVNFSDSRKYITYTTPEGKKCRDIKLYDDKFLKEMMENEFKIRQDISSAVALRSERRTQNCSDLRTMRNDYRTELESVDSSYSIADTSFGRYPKQTDQFDYQRRAETRNERLFGNAVYSGGGYDEFNGAVQCGSGNLYGPDGRISSETSGEYRKTGWEDERAVFTSTLTGEAEASQTYNEADTYLTNPVGHSHSLGTDSAFLFGALSEIIDEDYEPEDCTTQPVIVDKKDKEKHYGPVIGGM